MSPSKAEPVVLLLHGHALTQRLHHSRMLNKSVLHGQINRAFPVCGVQLDGSFIIKAMCENTSYTLKSIAALSDTTEV